MTNSSSSFSFLFSEIKVVFDASFTFFHVMLKTSACCLLFVLKIDAEYNSLLDQMFL